MSEPSQVAVRKLKILHVLRSPVGGLFRHVLDLAREQVVRGHAVGVIADSGTGGAAADRALAALEPSLALGLRRFPMRRNPDPADLSALLKTLAVERAVKPHVVHGHGAKGGLYARAVTALPWHHAAAIRVYTPHGGSLHYVPGSGSHAVFSRVERWLADRSNLMLFESAFAAERYRVSFGEPPCPVRVVLNGVGPSEFDPVRPAPDAADLVYVGELRTAIKGVDVLLRALASLPTCDRVTRLVLVGAGPDGKALEALSRQLGLAGQVTFAGAMPARQAFSLGRVLVVPSRAESLPYVVLEAAAAQVPMVATRVGGIPEIFGPHDHHLVAAGNVEALRDAILARLGVDEAQRQADVVALASHVRSRFSVGTMVDGVLSGYADGIAVKAKGRALAFPFRPLTRRSVL